MMSCFQITEVDLHIYVSKQHPNITEAVLFCYFSALGFDSKECNIVAALARRDKSQQISDTHIYQVETASVEELCSVVYR